ncbi:hypothetical protein ACOMICROBIO_GDFFDHBD_00842 [Vibrio sp. B1REV9]|nr:hypothetical protein ACOMICROBIO_GDFFDHBD_00842 [Vibrio sp. B1REV9]
MKKCVEIQRFTKRCLQSESKMQHIEVSLVYLLTVCCLSYTIGLDFNQNIKACYSNALKFYIYPE